MVKIVGAGPAFCVTKAAMFSKADFYEALKPFVNKHVPINLFLRFGGHYELIFNWQSRKPNGEFNPKMYVQLVDLNVSGRDRYVTEDLILDAAADGVNTDYKLYKKLSSWATESIRQYEAKEEQSDELQ